MQKSTLPTVGAVVSAVLASLCCLGPIALAAFGLVSLGGVDLVTTVFNPYRPYLIGITVALLGAGFFVTYRKKDETCQEGTACAVPRVRKVQKVGLWVIAGITGLVLAVPYLPWASSASAPATGPTEVAYFTVNGMDCAACASGIAASLTRYDGIADAQIDYEKGEAKVTYTPGTITPEQIAQRITEQGFPATPVKKPISQTNAKSDTSLATMTLRVTGMT